MRNGLVYHGSQQEADGAVVTEWVPCPCNRCLMTPSNRVCAILRLDGYAWTVRHARAGSFTKD